MVSYWGNWICRPARTPAAAPACSPSPSPRVPARARLTLRCAIAASLLHEPAVAHNEGLTGQGRARESGEEQHGLRDVFHRGEDAIHRAAEHHIANHIFFADAQFF